MIKNIPAVIIESYSALFVALIAWTALWVVRNARVERRWRRLSELKEMAQAKPWWYGNLWTTKVARGMAALGMLVCLCWLVASIVADHS